MDVVRHTFDERALPLVIEPRKGCEASTADLYEFICESRDDLEGCLARHGGLLFRGFGLRDAKDMEDALAGFGDDSLDYHGGNTPRTRVYGNVFTSTELTKLYKIKLHNELSFQPNYPSKITFFCKQPSREGGETILADTRLVYADIPEDIRRRFEERKVLYVRIFQEERKLREWFKSWFLIYHHLTWPQIFQTHDRSEVEQRCEELVLDHVWRRNGDLELRNVCPAVIDHPVTGERLWFNHVPSLHFNRRTLDVPVYAFRRLWYGSLRHVPTNVYYGDGSTITLDELDPVYDALDRHTVAFPWQAGDLLVLDNRIVAHGRNPFRGDREVYVSMTRSPKPPPPPAGLVA